MRFWSWFSLGKTLEDPVFGSIRFHRRVWDGTVTLPDVAKPVIISIFAGERGPSESQRALFQELLRRFEGVRHTMEEPLFTEYQQICAERKKDYTSEKEFKKDYPYADSPAEIWNVATLYRIEVYGCDFCFDHAMNWADDDHQLNVTIENWEVKEVRYEG